MVAVCLLDGGQVPGGACGGASWDDTVRVELVLGPNRAPVVGRQVHAAHDVQQPPPAGAALPEAERLRVWFRAAGAEARQQRRMGSHGPSKHEDTSLSIE